MMKIKTGVLTKKLSLLILLSFVLIFLISNITISISYYKYFEHMMADKLSQSVSVASFSNTQSFFYTIRQEALALVEEEPLKSYLEGNSEAASTMDVLKKRTDISVSVFMEVYSASTGEAISYNEYGHEFQLSNGNPEVNFESGDLVVLPVTIPREEGAKLPSQYTILYQKVSKDGSYIATGLSSNIVRSGILSGFILPKSVSSSAIRDGLVESIDSNFYLVNQDGVILSDYFSKFSDQPLSQFSCYADFEKSVFDEEHRLFNYNSPTYLMSCAYQERAEMYVVGVIQKKDILDTILPTLLMLYLFVFILLAIFCALCILVLHRAFSPYDKLVKKVSEHAKSSLDGAELLEEVIDKGAAAEQKAFEMVLGDYILDREIDLDTISVMEQRYPGKWTPIACRIDDSDSVTPEALQKCRQVIETGFQFAGKVFCIHIDQNKLFFVLCGENVQPRIPDVLKDCQQTLKEVAIGTSYMIGESQSRLRDVNTSYYSMRKAMFMWVCYGAESVITELEDEDYVEIPSNTISNLLGYINAGDREKITKLINQIFENFDGKKTPLTPLFFTQVTLSIISHIASFDRDQNVFDYQDLLNRVTEASGLPAAKKLISQLCFDACDYLSVFQNKSKGKQDIEVKMIEYLHEHYSNPDLSLTYLSNLFGYSAKYIGRIFKNYTNKFFTQYLTEVRMEKARELILSTDLPISEIYGAVGITSSQYFYRLFKKQYGYSPASIRKNNI